MLLLLVPPLLFQLASASLCERKLPGSPHYLAGAVADMRGSATGFANQQNQKTKLLQRVDPT